MFHAYIDATNYERYLEITVPVLQYVKYLESAKLLIFIFNKHVTQLYDNLSGDPFYSST